jgi:hypothetical protein
MVAAIGKREVEERRIEKKRMKGLSEEEYLAVLERIARKEYLSNRELEICFGISQITRQKVQKYMRANFGKSFMWRDITGTNRNAITRKDSFMKAMGMMGDLSWE